VFFEPDEAVSWVIGVGGAKDCGGGAVFAGFGDGLGGAVAGWVVGVDRDFSRGFGDALEAAERVVGVEGRAFGVLLFEQANQATGAVVFACDFFFSALL